MPEISLAVEAAVQRQDDLGLNPASAFGLVAASGCPPTCPDEVIESFSIRTTIDTNTSTQQTLLSDVNVNI
jgi:hypothetical protein